MNPITEKKFREVFAARLVMIMKDRGISGKQLAALIDIDEPTMSRIRNGKHRLGSYTIAKIADALNCTTDELISLKQDDFKLAGFSLAECKRMREFKEKHNLTDDRLLIETVKYMGPGLAKYDSLDKLLGMMSGSLGARTYDLPPDDIREYLNRVGRGEDTCPSDIIERHVNAEHIFHPL